MRFAQPGMLWLLLLAPALVGFLWWSWQKRRQLVEQFIEPRLLGGLLAGRSSGRARLRLGLVVLGYVFAVLGLARPQWGLVWEEVKQRGLDIVVAIDTSRSMLATDITPNRLARAKLATLDLLKEARTDRLGLVAFSGTAYLQCPLTTDDVAFRQSLDAVNVGLLPQGGTALAEAITTAMTAYKEEDNHRVLVLFSDGEDHDSGALEAARKAGLSGMKIFTVGLGTTEGELLRVPAEQGGTDYVRDEQGNVVKSRLNESLLTEIATATEGGFYLALRGANTIDTLYEKGLAPLPKSESAERLVKRLRDRFHWPLLLAIACLCAEVLIPERKRQQAGPRGPGALPHGGQIKAVPGARAVAVIALLLLPTLATASSSRALREYKSGDYRQALNGFSEMAKKNPDDPRLHFNAGTAAYRAGDLEAAARHFEQALGARDLNLQQQAYYNRGNTYFRQGEAAPDPNQRQDSWKKALKDFDTALKLNAKEPDAKFNYDYVKKQLEELQQQQQQQQDRNQDQNKDQNQQQQKPEQQQEKEQQQSESDQERQQQSGQDQQSQQQQQQTQDQRSKDEQQPQQAQQPNQDEKGKQEERPQPSAGESKPGDEKEAQESPTAPGELTPEQARQLLDSLKDGEQMMPIKPEGKPADPTRPVKDW